MLEIRNLTAGYPGNEVLSGISLSVPAGKVTVIIGPNGCGKSTLLKAVAGILPCSGSILLDGQELTELSGKLRARKVAFLPQNRQVPEITVEKLVLHGRFPYLSYPRQYRKEDHAAAAQAIRRMGLEEMAGRSLTELSGGQRQKAYIAMALAQDTPVVLLDEPNTYLDIAHQMQLMTHARLLAREGKTVVLVLHDLRMALEQGEHLVLIREGRALFQGTGEALFGEDLLQRTFGVSLHRIRTPQGWRYYYGTGQEIL